MNQILKLTPKTLPNPLLPCILKKKKNCENEEVYCPQHLVYTAHNGIHFFFNEHQLF